MSDVRVIKKYPNRRLYDTAISSYITLVDVKTLVLDAVDFRVVDAKTQEDLTRGILLQIISEEEEGGEPIFSSELLARVIRSYGGSEQDMLSSYLEKSLELWSDQQRVFRERTRDLMDNSPIAMLTQFAERNLAMWQAMSGINPDGKGNSAANKAASKDEKARPSTKDKPSRPEQE